MDGQKVCLKWDGFQSSITAALDSLRQEAELVDVTLCCEGQQVQAHRIMLSACSPYFREVFKDVASEQSVLFVKDTSAADLIAVIEFIYSGSVNVYQSQLVSFIQTAERLQIRGLGGVGAKEPPPRPATPPPPPCPGTPPPPPSPCPATPPPPPPPESGRPTSPSGVPRRATGGAAAPSEPWPKRRRSELPPPQPPPLPVAKGPAEEAPERAGGKGEMKKFEVDLTQDEEAGVGHYAGYDPGPDKVLSADEQLFAATYGGADLSERWTWTPIWRKVDLSEHADGPGGPSTPGPQERTTEPVQRTREDSSQYDTLVLKCDLEEFEVDGEQKGPLSTASTAAADGPGGPYTPEPQERTTEPAQRTREDSSHYVAHPSSGCSSYADVGHAVEHTDGRNSTGKTFLKCDFCDKSYSSKSLIRHRRIHTSEKRHRCNMCERAFFRAYNLAQHMLIHTGEKPYKCDDCGKAFARVGNLAYHRLTHTGEKPYKCDYCRRAFFDKHRLAEHRLTHTGEKSYKCDYCGKACSLRSNLTQHMLTHTGEKPYKCDCCGKSFARRYQLATHMLTHTGEKPYRCDDCGKAFGREYCLTKHKLRHKGEKPYKCDDCEKAFLHRNSLTEHRFIHTGEKLHKCDNCGKAFSKKGNLTQHLLVHTGEKPYRCDVCGWAFSLKSNLKKHILKHR